MAKARDGKVSDLIQNDKNANRRKEVEWLPVVGYESFYLVSNTGLVKGIDRHVPGKDGRMSLVNGVILKAAPDRKGYLQVSLSMNRKSRTHKVHRLVALAFIPNLENKSQVNHKNGLKNDNSVENLEWATPQENTAHAMGAGLMKNHFGEKSQSAKLKDCQVLEIRGALASGETQAALSKRFGVSSSLISLISNNKRRQPHNHKLHGSTERK